MLDTIVQYAVAPAKYAGSAASFFFSIPAVSSTTGLFIGIFLGLLVGYFIFIFPLATTVEPAVVPTSFAADGEEIDDKTMSRIITEIPIWVKNPDYDRVDWINSLLREMWPFIDKAVEAQVRAQVTPILASKKPAILQSLDIEVLSLGNLPPTLAGIKVYDTTDDEMIIEPVLKWAGNPNVVVAAKAFGLKASVQITDLTLFATARITLRPLVPVIPCFAKITVSLMEKPTVDFGLRIIGGDLMSIPGLYSFVQDTIANVASGMLLWPKVMEVYKSEDAASGKKPVGWLYIENVSAKNLKNIERFGFIDPYVTFSLGGRLGTKITSVKDNTLSPVWKGEKFQMLVKDPETQVLQIKVFDKETTQADRFLSSQQIPLKDLIEGELKKFDLNLVRVAKDADASNDADKSGIKNLGSIHLDLLFRQFAPEEAIFDIDDTHNLIPESVPVGGGVLRVQVHSGSGLEGKRFSNPFVRLVFRNQERETSVMRNATSVEFEEAPFDFTVDEAPVKEEILIQVWSKNLGMLHIVHSKEAIGHVYIPLKDVVVNKRINDIYQLNESRAGKLKIEMEWFEKKAPAQPKEEKKLEPSASTSASSEKQEPPV